MEMKEIIQTIEKLNKFNEYIEKSKLTVPETNIQSVFELKLNEFISETQNNILLQIKKIIHIQSLENIKIHFVGLENKIDCYWEEDEDLVFRITKIYNKYPDVLKDKQVCSSCIKQWIKHFTELQLSDYNFSKNPFCYSKEFPVIEVKAK